jgi:hypothetical protein
MSTVQNKFSIVEFESDCGVEVVPTLWLSEDFRHCKFPTPIPKGFSRIQSEESSVPEDNWTDYRVKLVGSFGKLICFKKI